MNLRCYIWRSMLYSFFINSINLTHNLSSPPSFLRVTLAENSWKKLLFKSRGTSVLCTGAEHWCYTSVFAVCGVTPVFSLALSLTLTLNTGNMTSRIALRHFQIWIYYGALWARLPFNLTSPFLNRFRWNLDTMLKFQTLAAPKL